MYLIHGQSGYFQSVAKMMEELLDGPYKYSRNADERGTWILFFPSYLSNFSCSGSLLGDICIPWTGRNLLLFLTSENLFWIR